MTIGPVQLIVVGFNHPDFHGEIIAELMTEKVNVEFPSPTSGKLVEVLHAEGDVVKKDQVIARLETA